MKQSNAPTTPPWHTAVMICTRCEKREENKCSLHSGDLKKRLKETLKDLKPDVRVVESSCLGICPEGGVIQAVIVSPGASPYAEQISDKEDLLRIERTVRAIEKR